MWQTCAEWHGRAAASTCGPSPSPRPVDRFATGRRAARVAGAKCAHRIRRSGCRWRDQREDLGVGPSVRAPIQEAHPLSWSIACGGLRGWDGRGVVSTVRGAHGTAVGMELEGKASSSRCPRGARDVLESCWGRASSGPAAEDLSVRPKYKGRLARAVRRNVCFACVPPRRPLGARESGAPGRSRRRPLPRRCDWTWRRRRPA